MIRSLCLSLCLLILAGCAEVQPRDYQGESPQLDLRQYFNGTIDAWGMFQDRSGKVVRRFTVVMDCHWVGDTGTLDEHFTYSDGKKEERVWTLHRLDEHHYTGNAGDVVGDAQGEVWGNALRWEYVLDLAVDKDRYHVNLKDWMYLQSDQVLLNRASMSKFGVHLGDITLSFRKRGP